MGISEHVTPFYYDIMKETYDKLETDQMKLRSEVVKFVHDSVQDYVG